MGLSGGALTTTSSRPGGQTSFPGVVTPRTLSRRQHLHPLEAHPYQAPPDTDCLMMRTHQVPGLPPRASHLGGALVVAQRDFHFRKLPPAAAGRHAEVILMKQLCPCFSGTDSHFRARLSRTATASFQQCYSNPISRAQCRRKQNRGTRPPCPVFQTWPSARAEHDYQIGGCLR